MPVSHSKEKKIITDLPWIQQLMLLYWNPLLSCYREGPKKGIIDLAGRVPDLNNFSSFILIAFPLESRDRHAEPWDTVWWSCFLLLWEITNYSSFWHMCRHLPLYTARSVPGIQQYKSSNRFTLCRGTVWERGLVLWACIVSRNGGYNFLLVIWQSQGFIQMPSCLKYG